MRLLGFIFSLVSLSLAAVVSFTERVAAWAFDLLTPAPGSFLIPTFETGGAPFAVAGGLSSFSHSMRHEASVSHRSAARNV